VDFQEDFVVTNRFFCVVEVSKKIPTGWSMNVPVALAKTPEEAEQYARRYCPRKLGTLKVTKGRVTT
jgi:hypothetical protein